MKNLLKETEPELEAFKRRKTNKCKKSKEQKYKTPYTSQPFSITVSPVKAKMLSQNSNSAPITYKTRLPPAPHRSYTHSQDDAARSVKVQHIQHPVCMHVLISLQIYLSEPRARPLRDVNTGGMYNSAPPTTPLPEPDVCYIPSMSDVRVKLFFR